MTRTRAFSAVPFLLLAFLFFTASAQSEGGTFVVGFDAADLTTADPHLAAATQDRAVVDMVFNGLIRYKPGDITEFEPDIAESWEVSDGNLTWTFQLRDDVMCHPWNGNPGYPLTSEDVAYSLQRSASADTSAYAGEYSGMEFVAVDPSTVEIRLSEPLSENLMLPKLADYAGGFIVCKQAAEDLGPEGFATHPVGTGPFIFDSYTPQQTTELIANPEYFRGAPKLAGVTVRYMPNVSAREAGLQTGELDMIEGVAEQPWVEKIRNQGGLELQIFGPGEASVLFFDVAAEPTSNHQVREAISYCLDRSEFRALIGEDITQPLYAPIPELLPGGLTEAQVRAAGLAYDTDRELAQSLLEEAGVGNLSIEMVTSERAQYLTPTQNLQAQLARCGINLDIRVVDHSTMHTLVRQGSNRLTLYVAWRPNADAFLSRFYSEEAAILVGSSPDTNFTRLGTTDLDGDGVVDGIDDLMDEARTTLDADRQIELWNEAQLDILEWTASYPMFITTFVYANRPGVDLGYDLQSTLALYPQITEETTK